MLPVQLLEWNRTEADYPRDGTIAGLFKQQVAKTPDALAVVAKDRQLSYRELDARSNRLARRLQSSASSRTHWLALPWDGRRPRNQPARHSQSRRAYVPLDPTHPKERLSLIIEDSGIPILLPRPKCANGFHCT